MIDATMATIAVAIMADASSTGSATTAVMATTCATTGRGFLSAKTRASSPVAFTASMPNTRTKSAVLICATKHIRNHAQTITTSAGTKVTTTIIATPVATMSRAGACILPCPAIGH
jgi:hypothetical protein